jgi:hypothetical protein
MYNRISGMISWKVSFAFTDSHSSNRVLCVLKVRGICLSAEFVLQYL